MSKPKLLILIEWFAPGFKAGGPIRSCVNICMLLRQHYDVYVITTNRDHGDAVPYQQVKPDQWLDNSIPGIHVYYGSADKLNRKVIRQLIAAVAPQFVYINLIFSPLFAIYPVWLAYTGKLSAKLILCPRGTLFKSALAVKTYKKLPLLKIYRWLGIQKVITFHATTTQEAEAVLNYFPGSDVVIAPNLPAINQPACAELEKNEGELACIFVARIVPIKNLLYVIEILQTASFSAKLTIVGPIEDEQHWEQCKSKIAELPLNVVVDFLGAQPAAAISALLQRHHLFILPTTGENFGHSIFEALSVGRPVLISDQTPWQDLDKEGCGWHFPLTQPSLFVEKLHEVAAMQQAGFDVLSQQAWAYAKRYIDKSELTKPYYELFS